MIKCFATQILDSQPDSARFIMKFFPEVLNSDERDSDGDTFLHLAVMSNNCSIAKSFLEVSTDRVRTFNACGQSPLGLAVVAGNVEMAKLLLSFGASFDHVNFNEHESALSQAVQNNNPSFIKFLLNEVKIDVDGEGEHALSEALMEAIDDDDAKESTILILLNAGASITKICKDHQFPTYFYAAAMGKLSIVKLLAQCPGWDVNFREDTLGLTVLDLAANHGHFDVCEFLMHQTGLNINAQALDGMTSLMFAAHDLNLEIVTLLMRFGADLHIRNEQGISSLDMITAKIQDQ